MTDEPMDAEVVWVDDTPAADLVPQVAEATVRQVPQGCECWWRLYSTPTSPMRDRQDHRVRSVSAHPSNPHLLRLELDGYGLSEITALAWRVNAAKPALGQRLTEHTLHDDGSASMQRIESLDLLVPYPPRLADDRPRDWQQMTNPGQLQHPGDQRDKWSYWDGGWQGGVGVRFVPADWEAQQAEWHRRQDAFNKWVDQQPGWHHLGHTKEDDQ